jgi:hypothetical protein
LIYPPHKYNKMCQFSKFQNSHSFKGLVVEVYQQRSQCVGCCSSLLQEASSCGALRMNSTALMKFAATLKLT